MKAVIVTGSRNWTDRYTLWKALEEERPDIIIHGAARGADQLAEDWVALQHRKVDYSTEVISMPAPWAKFGKAAGSYRNAQMLSVLLSLQSCGYEIGALAFPLEESVGTWDMVRQAETAGVGVKVFRDLLEGAGLEG